MTPRAQIINSIGLALALLGVAILFWFGPPQPAFELGTGIAVENDTPIDATGRTAKQRDQETTRLRQKHSRWSKVGLGFVFLGFVFQLWATWA